MSNYDPYAPDRPVLPGSRASRVAPLEGDADIREVPVVEVTVVESPKPSKSGMERAFERAAATQKKRGRRG